MRKKKAQERTIQLKSRGCLHCAKMLLGTEPREVQRKAVLPRETILKAAGSSFWLICVE